MAANTSSPDTSSPLIGRVAIITGVTTGISRAIATHLSSLGAKLVINYYDVSPTVPFASTINEIISTKVRNLVNECNVKSMGMYNYQLNQVVAVKADVSKPAEVKMLFDRAEEEFKTPPHILINCGGVLDVQNNPSLANMSVQESDATFNVTKIAFLTCREASNRLVRGGGGRIILITSHAVEETHPGYAAYAASNAAIETMVKVVAKELDGTGITVNCVVPEFVGAEEVLVGSEQSVIPVPIIGQASQATDGLVRIIGRLVIDAFDWVNGRVLRAEDQFAI